MQVTSDAKAHVSVITFYCHYLKGNRKTASRANLKSIPACEVQTNMDTFLYYYLSKGLRLFTFQKNKSGWRVQISKLSITNIILVSSLSAQCAISMPFRISLDQFLQQKFKIKSKSKMSLSVFYIIILTSWIIIIIQYRLLRWSFLSSNIMLFDL